MSVELAPLVFLAPFVWAICIAALVFRPRPHRPVWEPPDKPPIEDMRPLVNSLFSKKAMDPWLARAETLVPGTPYRGVHFPGNGLGGGVTLDQRGQPDIYRMLQNGWITRDEARAMMRERMGTMSPSGSQHAPVS